MGHLLHLLRNVERTPRLIQGQFLRIDEGSQVITVGRNAVRDGTSVQVLNSATAPDKDKAVAVTKLSGAQG